MKQAITIISFCLLLFTVSVNAREFSVLEDRVMGAYLAYYGRPPDPGGLNYWSGRLSDEGGDINSIINSFGESQEYQDRFGQLSNTELVTNLYDQLFGRAPDQGGLDYYVGKLDSNEWSLQEISLVILDGIQGDDVLIVDNRLEFSKYYVSSAEQGSAGDITAEELADFINLIDATPESLQMAYAVFEGDSPAPVISQSAEGLWYGSTDTGRYVTGLVLDDGTYYVLYSGVSDNYIAGVVQGVSTISGSSFTSVNGRDFNLEGAGILNATVSGSVTTDSSFDGTIAYDDGSESSFTATYDVDYKLTPSLASVMGDYSGELAFSLGFESSDISIASDGSIVGEGSSGCRVTGVVYPRASGNVYNVSITFGASPCYFVNQTHEGVMYYDVTANVLYSVTLNSNRSDGVLFVGSKN